MKFNEKFLDELIDVAVRKDYVAKGVCLALALVLWAYITISKSGEMTFRVPVQFENLSSGLVMSEISKRSASIIVAGEKDFLNNFDVKKVKIFVNLANPKVDESFDYPIEMSHSEIPDNIQISLQDNKVRLKIEKKITRNIPIVPVIGKPAEGFIMGKYSVDPGYITVVGPQSRVSSLTKINTKLIDISKDSGFTTKSADLLQEELKGLVYSIEQVRVTLQIIPLDNTIILSIPVEIVNSAKGLVYELPRREVRIFVRPSQTRQIDIKDIRAQVDVSKLKVNEKTLENGKFQEFAVPVNFILHESIDEGQVVKREPEELKIKVKLETEADKEKKSNEQQN